MLAGTNTVQTDEQLSSALSTQNSNSVRVLCPCRGLNLCRLSSFTQRKGKKTPPTQEGGGCHVVCVFSQSGVSAHCDPVQKDCFIKRLVVINERVELSTVLKVTS